MCSKTLKCVSDLKGWECIKNMENDMARNTERDEREATRRKEQLMKDGFKLFSENGIENVSLQKVADAADVGVATMYKYYQTKVKLVVAISGKIWGISGKVCWPRMDRISLKTLQLMSILNFIWT